MVSAMCLFLTVWFYAQNNISGEEFGSESYNKLETTENNQAYPMVVFNLLLFFTFSTIHGFSYVPVEAVI